MFPSSFQRKVGETIGHSVFDPFIKSLSIDFQKKSDPVPGLFVIHSNILLNIEDQLP